MTGVIIDIFFLAKLVDFSFSFSFSFVFQDQLGAGLTL